ncbi:discoidin domain-containing receptor 2-like isoform X1 [Vespa crabro]|uniref:discoidin domain-containing receptor 2-like isoform X1 n=1 Tax=Vespa crabro TaxID=7445 RepID=UPI001F0288DB|nr:discoidin domain-containing receptor 2-like isoform X1 [Vespa crabro]
MEAVVIFIGVLTVLVLCVNEPVKGIPGQCMLPLGMEEGRIPDDAITASSSYEMKSVGPQNARLRHEKNGGAWCPKAQISSAIREYLEIDLTKNHLITWTETQGRFGNGQGQEYAEAFFLEYWRDLKWHQYKNLKRDKVLRGNSNTYLVEKQKLDLPFVASRVRFVPYSQHPRTVCMRVEIYGCVWEQHIVRYVIPAGDSFGPNGSNVEDSSYDGTEADGILRNGLGQLIDGIFADESEAMTSSSGTNWVGWSNRDNVQLIFEFDDVREFVNCSIHVANLPQHDIEIFSEVSAWFSFDGIDYDPTEATLRTTDDIKVGTSLSTILLPTRIGKFVKLELKPKSKWLLLSEITFETVVGTRNLSNESTNQIINDDVNDIELSVDVAEKSNNDFNETIYEQNDSNLTPDAFPVNNSQTYIGLVSGALTVIALLLTCTIFLMKQRGRNKVALLQKHTALLCGSSAPGITINMKDVKLATPIVVNGLSQSRLSVKSKTVTNDDESIRGTTERRNSERIYERSSAYEKTYKVFSEDNHVYDGRSHQSELLSSIDYNADYTDFNSECNFSSYKLGNRVVSTPFPVKKSKSTQSGKINHKVYEGYYAATDILTIKRREQSSVFSLFTPLHIRDNSHCANNRDSCDIPRISRHRLRILDKLGEGSFGLVHLCEAKGIQNPDVGSIRNRQVVIVRSLWRGVVDSLKKDFTNDMHFLATIRDVNIARIIALVEEEPFGAVFEYGELGDLPSFLEDRRKSENDASLNYECSLNFIMQIASGMKYLENLNIPHRDLAARNCIVNQNLSVKVSDHAIYCNKYDNVYYVDGCYRKIPLRWMAWEAVILGKQSCRADIWSYAITVWEILTECKEIPYSDLTSEQVLENYDRWYNHTGYNSSGTSEKNQPRVLPQPLCSSADLYHMMVKCWSKQPENRPTFEEIYLYLKRLAFD